MLQSIRKITRGAGAYIFVAIVALPLSFFGFSWVQQNEGEEEIATVNDEPIKLRDLQIQTYREQQSELARLGPEVAPDSLDERKLRERALQSLLSRALMRQQAREKKLQIAPRTIDSLIVRDKNFWQDGFFSEDAYRQVLLQNGYTPDYYKREVMDQLLRTQMLSPFRSEFLTGQRLQFLYSLYRQERDFRYLIFSPEQAADKVEISEAEARASYEQNKKKYFSKEQVSVDYVVVRRADFYSEPEEELLREYYRNEVENLMQIYEASHILLLKNAHSNEQAEQKLQALRDRALSGESFAALAREYSEDFGSRFQGGYLGVVDETVREDVYGSILRNIWEPEFLSALYSLQRGEISAPTKTRYGWHLIYREEKPDIFDYEDRRTAILTTVRHANAQDAYFNYLPVIVDEISFVQSLEELPFQNQEEFLREGLFSREEAKGYFARPELLNVVFHPDFFSQGRVYFYRWSDEESLFVYPREHKPSRQLLYEEVREQVISDLRIQKSLQLLAVKARQWMQKARAGEDLQALLINEGLEWTEHENVRRNQKSDSPQIQNTVFSMPYAEQKSHFRLVDLKKKGIALLELQKVKTPSMALASQDQAKLEEYAFFEQNLQTDFASRLFLHTIQLRARVGDFRLN